MREMPTSRSEAKRLGLPRYFTGKPCRHGHVAERYVKGNCADCMKIEAKSDRFLDKQRRWRAANKRQMKHNNLKKYGLSFEAYEALLEKQGYKCAICKIDLDGNGKQPNGPAVDHCHSTNTVRGILCQRCNRGIGLLKDDCEVLAAAIIYLRGEACQNS